MIPLTFYLFFIFFANIATLKLKVTLLKDECDFLNKGIEKIKSAALSDLTQPVLFLKSQVPGLRFVFDA